MFKNHTKLATFCTLLILDIGQLPFWTKKNLLISVLMFGHLSTLMNLKLPQSPNKTDRKRIKTYALHECWYFQAGEKVAFSVFY